MDFSKDIVLITGASNGIGKALAQAYADKGSHVILADHDSGNGEKLVQDLMETEENVQFIYCDVRNVDDIHSLFYTLDEQHILPTILINNAGVSHFKNIFEVTSSYWDNVLHTNLRSAFLFSQQLSIRWKNEGIHGRIVNMASTRAVMSEPESEAYAASKGGLLSLTHSLAISLSEYQIRVNSISPGWIQTVDYDKLRDIDHNQHPSKRVGHPDDVVRACFYLTDKENSFLTGENITVDGGMTRKMIYEH
ncbi:SDR family NAD(P)-dependent oxidoreductase [Pontibacillus salicampi]|uniref:SDR family NAD(P)-dependent oxidoreductase n=1 Tax=Pontibacillus salicampi TaxID=1449801 RepID=A0ABV6LIH5_9BACI